MYKAKIRNRFLPSSSFLLFIKARNPGITLIPGNPTLTYASNFALTTYADGIDTCLAAVPAP